MFYNLEVTARISPELHDTLAAIFTPLIDLEDDYYNQDVAEFDALLDDTSTDFSNYQLTQGKITLEFQSDKEVAPLFLKMAKILTDAGATHVFIEENSCYGNQVYGYHDGELVLEESIPYER